MNNFFLPAIGCAFALLLAQENALAHPVAQGAIDVLIEPAKVVVTAHVSVEEALVVEGFSSGTNASDASAIWPRHGEYFLQHLTVQVDGIPVAGQLLRVTPPVNTAPNTRMTFHLEYPLPPGSPAPRIVALRQDVLNEIEFAPGNPWEATFSVTLRQAGGAAQGGLLFTHKEPLSWVGNWEQLAAVTTPQIDRSRMFWEYVKHGVLHILTGYDHLLFMAGLVLAVRTLLDLVKVVTAFTLAHTVTLTLSVLNVVRLPSAIVEPMIAASIVFVALQNVFWPAQSRGWTRLLVAFGFGLFHGLGFAGGLLEAMEGLPGSAIALAIFSFSLGVEIGHQAVVLPLFALLQVCRGKGQPAANSAALPRLVRLGSAGVCAAGVYYFVAALR